ncbi:MAG: nickel pincer cofactor biosynthesis protein LarB [Pseudomonadota bacterium]|nr:nickel pincer cofactor biosynthesis protein LarB [Pseudomonadota bacterium]MED5347767.1 nickel pincer cofactor biosynthesis protein LarB [Pseudomonadota bacterium]
MAIDELLQQFKDGTLSVDETEAKIRQHFFSDLGHTVVDNDRQQRTGSAEVIYAAGKTPEQVAEIFDQIRANGSSVLATRLSAEAHAALGNLPANATYHSQAQLLTWHAQAPEQQSSTIAVVTAGTSDMAVAEEAALTAEFYGNPVLRINDVGVAGLHRLLARIDDLRSAKVLIVVAGMEGALPSVVGGLVDKPVIAVPTSVGYGAAFDGVAALLGMLTSCASGISVVNIDNGFGAGFLANRINRLQ